MIIRYTRVLIAAAGVFWLTATATFLTGCDSLLRCREISNADEAIAVSKQRLLSAYMGQIRKQGSDESLFEDSEVGDFGNPCNQPEKFHFARHQWPNQPGEEFDVIWVGYLKGTCEGCWDTISVLTTVSKCGDFTFIDASRRPNQSEEKTFRNADGSVSVHKAWSCGPRSSK